MLDTLYINYLAARFPPLTYGSQWLLTAGWATVLAPLEWVHESDQAISRCAPTWAYSVKLEDLLPDDPASLWLEVAKVPLHTKSYGVTSDDSRVLQVLHRKPKAIAFLQNHLRVLDTCDLPSGRPYIVLTDWLSMNLAGKILEMPPISFDDLPETVRRRIT
jgi:hypothetical protein